MVQGCFTKIVLITSFLGLKTVIWDNLFRQGGVIMKALKNLSHWTALEAVQGCFTPLEKGSGPRAYKYHS